MKLFYLHLVVLSSILVWSVSGDVYMQSPRGSNNRLNENTATRNNANRVFDSQNNNRGGYNVGDLTDQPSGNDKAKQYQLSYFESSLSAKTGAGDKGISKLLIEWTAQHGCGGNENDSPNELNCNIVLQYMCRPVGFKITDVAKDELRDGTQTNTQDYNAPQDKEDNGKYLGRKNNVNIDRVLQEPFEFYDKCAVRERNKGLFTADQNLNCDNARCTRQNPNGINNRNGYECPEERDYYPYWHPTDWKDIAVLAQNASMCNYYQTESFNIKSKYECVENFDGSTTPKHYSKYNNAASCAAAGGEWLEFHNYLEIDTTATTEQSCTAKNNAAMIEAKIVYFWGRPMYFGKDKKCLVALDRPDCMEAPFSRTNHLGNGVDLEQLNYTWILPYFPSATTQRCALRIRYNISTDDYDPWKTTSSSNKNLQQAIVSPVQQNPLVDFGANNQGLRLAINTAQYGRTFQDRSHVFFLKNRPSSVTNDVNIINLSVRGKRGNIVQTYPAVEYDFVPTNLIATTIDLIHVQWTGSNTHNNQGGGDGQGGDDGEGTTGTDRNNMVAIGDRLTNYPLPFENTSSLFNNINLVWSFKYDANLLKNLKGPDAALMFASSGKFLCVKSATCDQSLEVVGEMDPLLNNAPASFQGAMFQVIKPGEYNYMCSRNNNFSNRSQKGTIIIA